MRNKLYSFFLLFIATAFQFPLHSQQLKIGLFNDSAIQTYIFSSEKGNYRLQYDSTRSINVERGSLLYIALLDSQLSIRDARSGSILISSAFLTSPDSDATFSLRPAYPAMNARKYKGNCSFTIGFRRIQAINEIKLNDYLTAVVAAEGGTSAPLEFYKAQAILCRTFLLAHSTKHATDGF